MSRLRREIAALERARRALAGRIAVADPERIAPGCPLCGCPRAGSPSSNLCGHCLMGRPCPRVPPERNPRGGPSDRELARWYDAQPEGDYTCTFCGRVGPKHYVQPQHPFYAEGRTDVVRCTDCHNREVVEARTRQKAALAQEPRCEVPGCRRRGGWKVAETVLLCGAHRRRAQAAYAGLGIWGGAARMDRESILRAAEGA